MTQGEGGRKYMVTHVKPIRPTIVEFKDEAQEQKFLNYAFGKTQTPERSHLKELLKNHRPAKERK
ncbi:hypothetical protein EFBL_3731 [Effusibacillus lacus]|uniref:Uncharacterized protein n=2 Tax=Effusibacillus lacus TaxID=1348429 RepID=A0A292YU68_9BACL|nr:hypothetical protein EFBL_3731 [Effusibacillus lacus]